MGDTAAQSWKISGSRRPVVQREAIGGNVVRANHSPHQHSTPAAVVNQQASSRAANSTPSLTIEKYAGTYSDAWYGPATVRVENNKLVFTLDPTPKAVGVLEHWQYDTFKAHWRDRTIEDAFVTFALKSDGTIDHFTMLPVSPLADFSFDSQDLYFTPVVMKTGEK